MCHVGQPVRLGDVDRPVVHEAVVERGLVGEGLVSPGEDALGYEAEDDKAAGVDADC